MSIIGVIGGSGLYKNTDIYQNDLSQSQSVNVEQSFSIETPFGDPSSEVTRLQGPERTIYFIARHGTDHTILPDEVNYQANIYALKKLGVNHILSFAAVGSLQEEIAPGDIVIPDQFIDRSQARASSFFGEGIVAHAQFADPFCDSLRDNLHQVIKESTDNKVHFGGTYLAMHGPQFSTRAESHLYRSWGCNIIGMTNSTEAKLAREAEISYASICTVTDYDCWRSESADVDISKILAVLEKNTISSRKIIKTITLDEKKLENNEKVSKALDLAIVTPIEAWPEHTQEKLAPILTRYLHDRKSN